MISCFAQKEVTGVKSDEQIRLFRQAAVNDLEDKIREVPLATIRSLVRFQVASFLWKTGKDDTGYARNLAVKALEELHEKRNEIPGLYYHSLQSEIMALLEARSPETAKKMSDKYPLSDEEKLDSAFPLFDQNNGEHLVADKLIKYFEGSSDISLNASFLIDELVSRGSPELPRVLSCILSHEESGSGDFSAESFSNLVDAFRNPIINSNLQARFYVAAMKEAREKLNSGDTELQNEYNLISAVLPDISANAPNLQSDATILKTLLNSVILRNSTEYDRAFDRIGESSDKLAATISEAETADNKSLKADLFIDAVNLALRDRKHQTALDVLEKLADLRRSEKEKLDRFYPWYDQCLGDIVALALKANNVELGKIASDRVVDKLTRATNLRKVAEYYFEKQDFDSASDVLKKSLKLTDDSGNSSRKIGVLLRLILAFHKIDKMGTSGVVENTAKSIDSIPSLDPADKPESEKYKEYINSIMAIDINITPVFIELLKTDHVEALNLAGRINKKEVKIMAGYALMVDSLTSMKADISKR